MRHRIGLFEIFLYIVLIVVMVVIAVNHYEHLRSLQPDQILPDPTRTPGATYSGVTQGNIYSTICAHGRGWKTSYIRPPMEYTQALKRKQIEEYGYEDKDMRSYEEDHLIPLTLGGHPSDPKNLWPESRKTKPLNALNKDRLEVYLNKLVCSRDILLKDAQDMIAKDWVSAYHKYNPPPVHFGRKKLNAPFIE